MNLMGVYLLISQKEMKTVRTNKEYKMYIRILENDDWVVEYDAENNQYRVSYFQDYHFVDEVLFDANEWVPVNERPPEECREVLVTVKDNSADSPIYYTAVGWYYAGIWVVEDAVCHQVIAWMRPPKPYREGGAENDS